MSDLRVAIVFGRGGLGAGGYYNETGLSRSPSRGDGTWEVAHGPLFEGGPYRRIYTRR